MVGITASGMGGVILGVALLAALLGVLYAVVRLAVRHEMRTERVREDAAPRMTGVGRARELHRQATAGQKYPHA